MKFRLRFLRFEILGVLFLLMSISSCKVYRNVPYFKDVNDSILETVKVVSFREPLIQFDDIISINVNTLDNQYSSMVNMPITSTQGGGAVQQVTNSGSQMLSSSTGLSIPSSSTYRIDKTGIIDYPLIGKIYAQGYSTSRLKDTIQNRIKEYYRNPVVDVKFANFRVTVMGEVLRPSTYLFNNEMVTVLDAIGVAGDLTIFGKRDNILLIRDSADKKLLIRLNINSKKLLSSPYFFLKQNDVLYIEPANEKLANLDASQAKVIPIISAVLSVLIIIATRIK